MLPQNLTGKFGGSAETATNGKIQSRTETEGPGVPIVLDDYETCQKRFWVLPDADRDGNWLL